MLLILSLLLVQPQIITCDAPCKVTVTQPEIPPVEVVVPSVTVQPANVTATPPASTVTPPPITVQPANITVTPAPITITPPPITVNPTAPPVTVQAPTPTVLVQAGQVCWDGSVILTTETCPPQYDIVISGDQGYTQWYRADLAANTRIGAHAATFHEANCKNTAPTPTQPCSTGPIPSSQILTVPILIERSPGVQFFGGTVVGEVPQAYGWSESYVDSSAIRVLESPNAVIDGLRATNTWDFIRVRKASNNFTIRNAQVENARDDAIENDYRHSGLIKNVLIDGALSCIALDPPSGTTQAETDGTGQTLRLEDFHCRLKLSNQGGVQTHGSPFKAGEDGRDLQVVAKNITLAISTPTPAGSSRLTAQMARFTCEASCYFLNLSDTPLSGSHTWRTARPNCTLLEGAAARAHWDNAEAAYRAANP